jgi:hypothetical protein
VRITPGTHITEDAINKQLADKERVAAALGTCEHQIQRCHFKQKCHPKASSIGFSLRFAENGHLLEVVNKCIANTDRIDADSNADDAY